MTREFIDALTEQIELAEETRERHQIHQMLLEGSEMNPFDDSDATGSVSPIDAEAETVRVNQRCPRCGFITGNVFDCVTCKSGGDNLFGNVGATPTSSEPLKVGDYVVHLSGCSDSCAPMKVWNEQDIKWWTENRNWRLATPTEIALGTKQPDGRQQAIAIANEPPRYQVLHNQILAAINQGYILAGFEKKNRRVFDAAYDALYELSEMFRGGK